MTGVELALAGVAGVVGLIAARRASAPSGDSPIWTEVVDPTVTGGGSAVVPTPTGTAAPPGTAGVMTMGTSAPAGGAPASSAGGGGGMGGMGGGGGGAVGGAIAAVGDLVFGTAEMAMDIAHEIDELERGDGHAALRSDLIKPYKQVYQQTLESLAARLRDWAADIESKRPKPHKPAAASRQWLRNYLAGEGYSSSQIDALLDAANADKGESPITKFKDYVLAARNKVRSVRDANRSRTEAGATNGHAGKAQVLARYGGPAHQAWATANTKWQEYQAVVNS